MPDDHPGRPGGCRDLPADRSGADSARSAHQQSQEHACRTPELPGSFAALGVAPDLVTALESDGITEPFPIQALTIADALAGRDVCGKAKTGSGKTLAFGLPVLQRLAIPSRHSLVRTAPAAGPGAGPDPGAGPPGRRRPRNPWPGRPACELTACYGGAGMDAPDPVARPTARIWSWPRPGRLIDLRQRGVVDLDHIDVVVIDEADRMADMGFHAPG